jgi:hypothetical protein
VAVWWELRETQWSLSGPFSVIHYWVVVSGNRAPQSCIKGSLIQRVWTFQWQHINIQITVPWCNKAVFLLHTTWCGAGLWSPRNRKMCVRGMPGSALQPFIYPCSSWPESKPNLTSREAGKCRLPVCPRNEKDMISLRHRLCQNTRMYSAQTMQVPRISRALLLSGLHCPGGIRLCVLCPWITSCQCSLKAGFLGVSLSELPEHSHT